MNFNFLAGLGTVIFFAVLIAILAQIPLVVLVVSFIIIIGALKK